MANSSRLHMGMALHQSGRVAEAEAIYRSELQRDPTNADAMYLLGIAAVASGKFQRGADLLGRSIRLRPDFAPAYCNRGIALVALQRSKEALASYDKAIALQSDFIDAHYNRAVLLQEIGRSNEAIDGFQAALALRPDFLEALNNLGLALNRAERHQDALEALDRALALQPNFAGALCNRGNALLGLDQPEAALHCFDQALAVQADLPETWCDRAGALLELGRIDDAAQSARRALELRPRFAEAEFALSLALLALGQYEPGFLRHEARLRRDGSTPVRPQTGKPWRGREPLSGKTLLIESELYLGDMIQFCRYARLATAQGARVILSVQPELKPVLSGLGPGISVVSSAEKLERANYHCPLMSLPLAFRTTEASIPAAIPYLRADPDLTSSWQERIGTHGFRIGVCWHGSAQRQALQRSFPLSLLRGIAAMKGVRLISLQTGAGTEQLDRLPQGMMIEHYEAAPDAGGLRPFTDSAAMMANLDLVISLDSAIAHLAGAMGRPVWIALKFAPDWRWGTSGPTTPWYPTARLFRQPARHDWMSVFADIQTAVAKIVSS